MATDDEIQRIIEQGEAGIEDLVRAYELAEGRYMSAAAQVPLEPTYIVVTAASTSPARPR